ncbi:MAG: sulfite exporter TauE/SafE family protein [Deltaproteobacteria bacterium]|nr:sulfite exporter TauE/SafE family protein [Deltaproteobacteria bacterium]
MDSFLANVAAYIHTSPLLALGAVFLAGLLTASNPCVLSTIPLMMSFVAGRREEGAGLGRAFGYSLTFVLGLNVMFAGMGLLAALAGQFYGDVSGVWKWVVAGVCVVMGLHLAEVIRFPIPGLTGYHPKATGLAGAFLLGLLFGLVSAPCAGPILIVLLTYLAGADASVAWGALLLLVYGLGHSALVLVAGTSMGAAKNLLSSKGLNRATLWMRRGAGGVIVLVGLFFAWQAVKGA